MTLDPQLLASLDGLSGSDLDDVAGSRLLAKELSEAEVAVRSPLPTAMSVQDTHAVGPLGQRVPIRIYRRENLAAACGALLFIHGGGFVFGDLESEHDRCVFYAQHSDAVIVSVDYRLAPEFPYPAALDDVTWALDWLVRESPTLGIDPQRICVGGASAGGALAAGVVLRARDNGTPHVAAQMLLYPALDDRGDSASMAAFERGEPWDATRSRQSWRMYLGQLNEATPDAAPARNDDLRRLPVTFMLSCEEDPLRDEDLDFALRLIHYGVSTEIHHYRGTYHAFDVIAPHTELGHAALIEQAEFIQRVTRTSVSK